MKGEMNTQKRSQFIKLLFCLGLFSFFVCLLLSLHFVDSGEVQSYAKGNYFVRNNSNILRIAIPVGYKESMESPYGVGMSLEILEKFTAENNYKIIWLEKKDANTALHLVANCRADLAIGFGGEVCSDLATKLEQGPVYFSVNPVLVKPSKGAALINPYYLNAELQSSLGATLKAADFEAFTANNLVLLDPFTYSLLIFSQQGLKLSSRVDLELGYRWFWSKRNSKLAAEFSAFWQSSDLQAQLAEMGNRYHDFIPVNLQSHHLRDLSKAMKHDIQPYSKMILKAAEETGLDPFLITAVIFQESRFNPDASSHTGVRGIMQLTSNTAKMLNVNRLDAEECILGGSRYLKQLWDSLDGKGFSDSDRLCFVLAAYNQGPGNLRKAMSYVGSSGKDVNWIEVRNAYVELSKENLGSKYFNHEEALNYVSSVRYYYYILSKLAGSARLEVQDFTALRTFASAYF